MRSESRALLWAQAGFFRRKENALGFLGFSALGFRVLGFRVQGFRDLGLGFQIVMDSPRFPLGFPLVKSLQGLSGLVRLHSVASRVVWAAGG